MKTKMILLCWVLILSYSTYAQSDLIFPGVEWEFHDEPEDVGYDGEKLILALPFLRDSMNTTGLMIVVGGKVLGDFGDIDELSYLASCRKSILAMLYGKYVADGTIDLDLNLKQMGINDINGLYPSELEATVQHLITARSGIYHAASNAGDNLADAPDRASQKAGAYFLYNNWDFNAAGAVFEQLSGKNIYDALEEDLALPLQMEDFDREAQRKSGNTQRSRYRAYHIWLSTRDMARIGYLMLREGQWNGKQIIPAEWARKIVSIVTPSEEMNPERIRNGEFGYGYMWWVWDGPYANGPFEGAYTARGAYGQYITVIPKLDMVVAHKTKAEYRRRTSWSSYKRLLELIIESKIGS